MLINLSNHPIETWTEKQIYEAEMNYDSVVEIPFPVINPDYDEKTIRVLAAEYFEKIQSLTVNSSDDKNAVHIMGELTFTFALVNLLIDSNIECIASTTSRNSMDYKGTKISKFEFVKFRKYSRIRGKSLAANSLINS